MQRLGYGIAALTLLAMLLRAIVSTISDHPRTYDYWAYVTFIVPPTVVFLILGIRGHRHAGWGFLVSAFGAEQAADYGLTSHWVFAIAFVLATTLAQVMPMWRDGLRAGTVEPQSAPPADQ